MVEIPENFGDLKRPALQKLCKRLGLKANGKPPPDSDLEDSESLELKLGGVSILEECESQVHPNVDMISAIRDFKSQASLSSDDTHAETPPTAINTFEKLVHSPPDNEHMVKKGQKRKGGSRRNASLQSQNCSEEISTTSVLAVNVDSPQEFVSSTSESQVMEGISVGKPDENVDVSTCSSPLSSQKSRKRKRRGTHSISPPPKQLRASIPVVEPSPLPFSKMALETNTHESSIADQPPISPPESTGRLSNRKRRATFSISPPSSSHGPAAPNADINLASCQLQPPSPKRSRQSTIEVSPEADDSGQKASGLVGEGVDPDSSVKTEILTLLHQRVDDRKADPSYKPVFGATELNTSRIPIKSATARKFERAHQRQFRKMASIVDHQTKKERGVAERKSSGVPAKKPRVHVDEAPVPSRIPKARPNASGPFKPSVLSTKNVTLNFRQSLAKIPGTAKVQKVSKTPNKPFVFSGVATPKCNQGRTAAYKPHTGTLPQFNFSLY